MKKYELTETLTHEELKAGYEEVMTSYTLLTEEHCNLETGFKKKIEECEELKKKVIELEVVVKELQKENETLKETSDRYNKWWQESDRRNDETKEAMKALSIMVSSVANKTIK